MGMYKLTCDHKETDFPDLASAMNYAKILGKFVTITGNGMEIVGMFGADSVQDGLCPDGIAYDWNKESRIGRVKKERV